MKEEDECDVNPDVSKMTRHLLQSSDSASNYVEFVVDKVWQCLPEAKGVLSPDKFHSMYVSSTDALFNGEAKLLFFHSLKDNVPFHCSEESLYFFLGFSYLELCKKLEIVVLQCLREPYYSLLNTVAD